MADRTTFPLDRSKGLLRGVVAAGLAFLTLVMGAATLYLLLSCFLPFYFEDLWLTVLILLPMAAGALWFAGAFFLSLVRMYTRAAISEEGVTLMLPMMTSNLPASRAGMMPSQLVGTSWHFTPRSLASLSATSISKPMYLPSLSCMAQGTKDEKPTRSVPRCTTFSMTGSRAEA